MSSSAKKKHRAHRPGFVLEVDRSSRLFSTCTEALLDSARAAAALSLGAIEPVADEGNDTDRGE